MDQDPIKCTKNLTSCSSQYGRRWAPWSCTATRWAWRVVCGGRARVGLTRSRKGHAYPPGAHGCLRALLFERRQQRPGFPTRRHPPEPEVHHQRHLAAERRGHRPTWGSGAPPSWGESGTAGECDGTTWLSIRMSKAVSARPSCGGERGGGVQRLRWRADQPGAAPPASPYI